MKLHRSNLWLIAVAAMLAGMMNPIASGALVPTVAGPKYGVDDYNTSALNPSPLIAVSTIGQCPWINTGLTAYETTNNTATSVWTHTWASQADQTKVEAGINILDYYAWVVKTPAVTAGNAASTVYAGNNTVRDVGGAVINLTYDQTKAVQNDDSVHLFNNLHWVQGLIAHYDTYAPGEYQVRLDNPFAFDPGNNGTPFYDDGGAAGQLANGGGWFLDRPFKVESEPAEATPVADLQFQVVLADETDSTVAGVTTHAITLYGGEWWGYKYTAVDGAAPVPLPASAGVGLSMLGGFGGLALLRKRLRRNPQIA